MSEQTSSHNTRVFHVDAYSHETGYMVTIREMPGVSTWDKSLDKAMCDMYRTIKHLQEAGLCQGTVIASWMADCEPKTFTYGS